jgi:hypothetical protein
MITQDTFSPFAFPIVKVRYSGPTDYHGAKWIATLRRDNERTYRVHQSYDDSLPEGAQNALQAALACFAKCFADLNPDNPHPISDYIAIPADLSANEYAFTFVPSYFFND